MDMLSSAISLLISFLISQFPTVIVLLSTIYIAFNKIEPGKLLNTTITALIILLIELFFRLLVSVLPPSLLLSERTAIELQPVMFSLNLMFSLLHALGLGLLAWVLIKALPKKQAT